MVAATWSPAPSPRPPRRARTVLLAVVVPAALVAGTLAWCAGSWPADTAPNPSPGVGTQEGGFDGLVSATLLFLMPVWGLSVLMALGYARVSQARRYYVGLALGAAGLASGAAVSRTHAAANGLVPPPFPYDPTGVAAAIILGASGWWLAGSDPRLPASGSLDARAPRWTLTAEQRVIWRARLRATPASFAPTLLQTALPLAILSATIAHFPTVTTGLWALWLAAAVWWTYRLVTEFSWTIRVNTDGVHAQGWLGRPRFTVPADEIPHAEATPRRSTPWWGYGVRHGGGEVQLHMGPGPGILIHATGARSYLLVAPGADEAVRTINTIAERARTPDARGRAAASGLT